MIVREREERLTFWGLEGGAAQELAGRASAMVPTSRARRGETEALRCGGAGGGPIEAHVLALLPFAPCTGDGPG